MTKKDYELIARVFNNKITKVCVAEEEAWILNGRHSGTTELYRLHTEKSTLHRIAETLATELKAENREFDTDKFLNQAGVLNNQFDIDSSQYRA